MGQLFQKLKQAVREERYDIGRYANERLRERRIPAWQVVAGIETGTLLSERADARPNPAAEVQQDLPDGTPVKAVRGRLEADNVAKLVQRLADKGDVDSLAKVGDVYVRRSACDRNPFPALPPPWPASATSLTCCEPSARSRSPGASGARAPTTSS